MKHTYKRDLISRINRLIKQSGLASIPHSCLNDMSTQSLARFHDEWVHPLAKGIMAAKSKLVSSLPQLPPSQDNGDGR